MLKNSLRKLIGLIIVVVFGIAIYRFAQQTSGNAYVVGALFSGLKLLLFLAAVLWLVYLFDRKMKQRSH